MLHSTGFHKDDSMEDIYYIVDKILNTKFFFTNHTKCRSSVKEEDLEILCVQRADFFPVFQGNRASSMKMPEERSREFHARFVEVLQRNYDNKRIVDGGFCDLKNVQAETDGCPTATLDSRS